MGELPPHDGGPWQPWCCWRGQRSVHYRWRRLPLELVLLRGLRRPGRGGRGAEVEDGGGAGRQQACAGRGGHGGCRRCHLCCWRLGRWHGLHRRGGAVYPQHGPLGVAGAPAPAAQTARARSLPRAGDSGGRGRYCSGTAFEGPIVCIRRQLRRPALAHGQRGGVQPRRKHVESTAAHAWTRRGGRCRHRAALRLRVPARKARAALRPGHPCLPAAL
mmetsp:Transcript_30197/g.66830  ORF Transcript_30197/g.66830 Transcript_30197/m.66830 type:complete len:217 (+) Transcript_30197:318-968(+)